MAPKQGQKQWPCFVPGCSVTTLYSSEHSLRDHISAQHDQYYYSLPERTHIEVIRTLSAQKFNADMSTNREQRTRVPSAKAAGNKESPQKDDPKALQITPPEYVLPDDQHFNEAPLEITKIEPLTKISSTTGEEIKLYKLGPHVEDQSVYHYTRAQRDPITGLFHSVEAKPHYARFSDEAHVTCTADVVKRDVRFSKDMRTAYGGGPHSTFKANVCAREGTYFFEAKLKSCAPKEHSRADLNKSQRIRASAVNYNRTNHGTPRIGFARREHPFGLPNGTTAYSYALGCWGETESDLNWYNLGQPSGQTIIGGKENTPITEEDVIGFMITLPSLDEHKKIVEAVIEPKVTTAGPGGSVDATKAKKAKKPKKNKGGKKKRKGKSASAQPEAMDDDDNELSDRPSTVDIIRDRFPITAKGGVYYESLNYRVRPELDQQARAKLQGTDEKTKKAVLEKRPFPSKLPSGLDAPPDHEWPSCRGLPGSKIEVWHNGKYCGILQENLLAFLPPASVINVEGDKKHPLPDNMKSGAWDDAALGYYPAFSGYDGAIVEFKFKDFWYGHDGRKGVKDFEEAYNEQIIEDMCSDLVDEIGWEYEHKAAQRAPTTFTRGPFASAAPAFIADEVTPAVSSPPADTPATTQN